RTRAGSCDPSGIASASSPQRAHCASERLGPELARLGSVSLFGELPPSLSHFFQEPLAFLHKLSILRWRLHSGPRLPCCRPPFKLKGRKKEGAHTRLTLELKG